MSEEVFPGIPVPISILSIIFRSLLHPEELLKKYQLFSGYENQILRSDGEQGFIISSRAIQSYLADQAIKQSA